MKTCMNPKCGAEYQRGTTIKIEYFDAVTNATEYARLETCSRDCAFAAQSEHGEKSQIEGRVLAGQALRYSAMATDAKRYGGMRS